MTDRYILEAIQKGVIAAVAASSMSDLPVRFMGRNHESEDADKSWLEFVYLPNDVQNELWSDGKTYRGVFRLILHAPMKDLGVYAPMDLLTSIGSYFSKGSRLSDPGNNVTLRITDHPNFMGIMEEPPELLLPLSIRYQYFKAT